MKTIVITGSSSGFGYCTAMQLAKEGNTVIACMRNSTTTNKEAAEALSAVANIEVLELDLASSPSIAQAAEVLKARKIDVLINNAGVAGIGFAEMHSIDKVRSIFEVNVFGLFDFTSKLIPQMREQKDGLIVTVTSIVGRLVMPMWGAYGASKFAAEALAETWRYELQPLGIESVIIEPGPHPTTGMGGKMEPYTAAMPEMEVLGQYGHVAQSMQEFGQQMQEEIANGTFQKPEALAQVIVSLVNAPKGSRPMRTVVDRDLGEAIGSLNTYTDGIYAKMYGSQD